MCLYEATEIERWFEVQCNTCEKELEIKFVAFVWRDGTIYGDWHCQNCGKWNYSEDLGNTADMVDHDAREGK